MHTNRLATFQRGENLSLEEQEQIMRVIHKAEYLDHIEQERIGSVRLLLSLITWFLSAVLFFFSYVWFLSAVHFFFFICVLPCSGSKRMEILESMQCSSTLFIPQGAMP